MLLVCKDCTAKYSVGATTCPQCGSTKRHEEGAEPVAKRRTGTASGVPAGKSSEDKQVESAAEEEK